MKVALIGATGKVATPLTCELVSRGHTVAAITTHRGDVFDLPVTSVAGDANDRGTLPGLLAGHDVMISSIQFRKTDHDALIESV